MLANDIFIPKTALKGGKTGDKAVVRITEWPDRARNPYGEVVDILGPAGENNTEIHAILAEFGLPYRYPEAVEKAANKIPDAITDEEIAAREDFRQVTTFTIDPKDAKDFDDALSIRRRELLCKTRQYHRQGGRKPGNLGLSGGSCRADVARTIVQRNLFVASRRG